VKHICVDTNILVESTDKSSIYYNYVQKTLRELGIVIYVPTICLAEFVKIFLKKNKTKKEIKTYFEEFTTLSSDNQQFHIAKLNSQIAFIAGCLERKYSIGIADAIISATYFFHKCNILKTKNIRDFSKVSWKHRGEMLRINAQK